MFDVHPETIRKWQRRNMLWPTKLAGSQCKRFTAEVENRPRREMGLPADEAVQLYRVGQGVKMLVVHPNTVRESAKTGILPSIRRPVSNWKPFTPQDVDRLQ